MNVFKILLKYIKYNFKNGYIFYVYDGNIYFLRVFIFFNLVYRFDTFNKNLIELFMKFDKLFLKKKKKVLKEKVCLKKKMDNEGKFFLYRD